MTTQTETQERSKLVIRSQPTILSYARRVWGQLNQSLIAVADAEGFLQIGSFSRHSHSLDGFLSTLPRSEESTERGCTVRACLARANRVLEQEMDWLEEHYPGCNVEESVYGELPELRPINRSGLDESLKILDRIMTKEGVS